MRCYWKQSYTLVEILVVLAIIGVLMSISMPTFEKITKGNRVGNAASNIGTALSLARSQAIANRRCVAVIIPANSVDDLSGSDKAFFKPYQFRGFRLCYVTYDNASGVTFVEWVPNSKWEMIPEGTVIAEADSKADPGGNLLRDFDKVNYSGLNTVNKPSSGTQFPCNLANCAVVFTPFGQTINDSFRIITADGIFASKTTGEQIFTSPDGTGKPFNYIAVKIRKFTGRVSYE